MPKHSYEVEHVLMTADAVGGVWTYAIELAKGLARHGVRTTLATMGPLPTEDQRREAEAISGLTLYSSDYKLEWMSDPWQDVETAGKWLLALAERIRPDVVHLNGYCHATLPWPAPVIVACHSDVLSWWEAVKGEPAPEGEWSEYARRVREGLRCAGMVIAPTAAMLEAADRNFGPFEASRTIYNGRTSPDLYPAAKRNIVFSAGRLWDDAKNIRALVEVAPRLKWPTYVAGDFGGAERPRVRSLNLLGRLPSTAIGAWYSRAGIYCLPAKYEPFGLSVLEAALSGCALVLGDIPTLRELWSDVAVFVDPDDREGLIKALNWLADDDDARNRLGKRALACAQKYDSRTMACSTLFAYQDLKQTTELDLQLLTATYSLPHGGISLL